MSTRMLNLDRYRATLLSKADECRKELRSAEERQLALQGIGGAFYLLRQVESALSRMERRKYGRCMKCDEDIEQVRLEAAPWALFCAGCQASVDLLHERVSARRNELKLAA